MTKWSRFFIAIQGLFAANAASPRLHLHLLRLGGHSGAGSNGLGNKGVRADHRIPADHRLTTQHGSTSIDGNIILNGGMTALAPQALAAPGGERAQGHALVESCLYYQLSVH